MPIPVNKGKKGMMATKETSWRGKGRARTRAGAEVGARAETRARTEVGARVELRAGTRASDRQGMAKGNVRAAWAG